MATLFAFEPSTIGAVAGETSAIETDADRWGFAAGSGPVGGAGGQRVGSEAVDFALILDRTFWELAETLAFLDEAGVGTDGCLLRVLCLFEGHGTADGALSGYTARQIERMADWRGQAGRLVQCMVAAGWLAELPEAKGWRCVRMDVVRRPVVSEAECAARLESARVEWAAASLAVDRERIARQEEEAAWRRGRARKGGLAKAAREANALAGAEAVSNNRISNSPKSEIDNVRLFDDEPNVNNSAAGGPGDSRESRKTAFEDGQSPEFQPSGEGQNAGAAKTRRPPGYWKGIEAQENIPNPAESRTPEAVKRAMGMVRGLIQTSLDRLIGQQRGNPAYCEEIDEHGGGCWGAFAKQDAGALICACLELKEALDHRRNIEHRARFLNAKFHEHRNRRLAEELAGRKVKRA